MNNPNLTEAVKALRAVKPNILAKEALAEIRIQYPHIKTAYRMVYNTIKRLNLSEQRKLSTNPTLS